MSVNPPGRAQGARSAGEYRPEASDAVQHSAWNCGRSALSPSRSAALSQRGIPRRPQIELAGALGVPPPSLPGRRVARPTRVRQRSARGLSRPHLPAAPGRSRGASRVHRKSVSS